MKNNSDQTTTAQNGDRHRRTTTTTADSDDDIAATAAEDEAFKRLAAKQLIERYFYQLSDGCGNPKCMNRNCASSTAGLRLTPNQAAAKAIQLYTQEAKLCDPPAEEMSPDEEGCASSRSVVWVFGSV